MQKLKLVGLSILSGLLMGISWPATGNLAPLFFIALIPLLYVEHVISQTTNKFKSRHLFFLAYLTFIVFNTYTTWWIWNADETGMILAEVLYSLFMAVTFLCFHNVKKRLGNKKGYFALVALWIGFEWLHYNWEFSHPWNALGNTFANFTPIVQWYEYTGVMGGTLWILVVNILLFGVFQKTVLLKEPIKNSLKKIGLAAVILILPILFSIITYHNYTETENPIEVVVIQPNINPYTEKFGGMSEADQMERIITLAREKVTPNTKYVVAPETAIPRSSVENEIEGNMGIIEIRRFLNEFPHVLFIIGSSTYIYYDKSDERPTATARKNPRTQEWYDAFNTALLLDTSSNIQTYHKSKLVLGVEKLPYPAFFAPFEKFAIDLGGTFGSVGVEKESHNLIDKDVHIAPVICYESIYGDYVSSYVKKGANVIFIITNDGWWDDTPGYKQHLAYARLRAIETRRSIARSANTGTSCYINQRGDISKATNWLEPKAINSNINTNNEATFYSNNGDLIGRVAAAISVLLLLWSFTLKIKARFS